MISIAIVEDDKQTSEVLRGYVMRVAEEMGRHIKVESYGDGLGFLDAYRSQFDIVLLDIELPNINGISVAEKLRAADDDVTIIFVTYMSQFAVRGYEVRAFDFIVKPVEYHLFAKKLENAIAESERRAGDSIIVKTPDGVERLSVSKIKYIEISGHKMQIHMTDRTVNLRCSISEMEEKLRPYHFLRCNVCYLLNPVHIDKITNNQVQIDGVMLSISRSKKKDLLQALTQYFNSRG